MRRVLLITYKGGDTVLKDRIKKLGPNFPFWGDCWFVETDLATDKVYEQLTGEEFKEVPLLIVEIAGTPGSYHGRMSTFLWNWLEGDI